MEITGPDAFMRRFAVSRETTACLERYAALLTKWNPHINLVGKSTLPGIWSRHFADSAQLWLLKRPDRARWIDLGSGAGFPGLVIAILARDIARVEMTLIESDARKAAFLQTAITELGVSASVRATRIEATEAPPADVVSARALASLAALISFTRKLRRPEGVALFLKGQSVHKEISEAKLDWDFDYRLHPSLTEPKSAVVEVGTIHGARG